MPGKLITGRFSGSQLNVGIDTNELVTAFLSK